MNRLRYWIEAMRLRTLPVSAAGVVMAIAYNIRDNNFNPTPAIICLIFAILAQIASNFANEYFDYTAGRDRPGREGPRRGVTEGEIKPESMKRATYITLGMAGCFGLSLVGWGGWWLVLVGILIAIGVFAYSAGPFPLSTHGWGEAAVVIFFGIIPVNFTYYVQTLTWSWPVVAASIAIGLMGANVLIINNYRDRDDDSSVGKNTLCVRYGRAAMRRLYMFNACSAAVLLMPSWNTLYWSGLAVTVLYLALCVLIVHRMAHLEGAALTPLLGATSILMFGVSAIFLILYITATACTTI